MKLSSRILFGFALVFCFSSAWASPWQMDKDHTEIRFRVSHILTSVSGYFTDFNSDIMFDPKNPGSGKFDFTVKVKSINTNNGKRDTHLRSKDFFDSDAYPEMRFKTSRIAHIKDNLYTLEGMITIKDVTKKLTTQFLFIKPQLHPFVKNKYVGGFVTQFTIPRLDYHVGSGKFLKMGVVGSTVDVEIAMEALTEK